MINTYNISKNIVIGELILNEFAAINQLEDKRQIESLGKTYLLNHLLNTTVQIDYDANGKPYIIGHDIHISISHSYNKLVIITNTLENTGIDIEIIKDKVLRIKHKFLSETELENAGSDAEKCLIYWAAKETLYKIYGLKEVDFIKNLSINPFEKHTIGTIIGHINMPNYNHTFELNYLKLDEYMMVYALKKLN